MQCSQNINLNPTHVFWQVTSPLWTHVFLRHGNYDVFLQVILIVVLIFGLSWLPLHVQSLVAIYGTLPAGTYGIMLAFQSWHSVELSISTEIKEIISRVILNVTTAEGESFPLFTSFFLREQNFTKQTKQNINKTPCGNWEVGFVVPFIHNFREWISMCPCRWLDHRRFVIF